MIIPRSKKYILTIKNVNIIVSKKLSSIFFTILSHTLKHTSYYIFFILNAMVRVYINTRKTTFLFQFQFLTSFFQIISLQVNKKEALSWHFLLFNVYVY